MPESMESSRVSIRSRVFSSQRVNLTLSRKSFKIWAYIVRDISEVESDLPEDIRDDALRVFRSAIAEKSTIQDAINKVNVLQRLYDCIGQIMRKWAEFENLNQRILCLGIMRWLLTGRWTKRHFARLRNGSKARDSRQEDYLASMDASTQDKIEDHKGESELQHFFTDCMKLFFAACVSVTNPFLICGI